MASGSTAETLFQIIIPQWINKTENARISLCVLCHRPESFIPDMGFAPSVLPAAISLTTGAFQRILKRRSGSFYLRDSPGSVMIGFAPSVLDWSSLSPASSGTFTPMCLLLCYIQAIEYKNKLQKASPLPTVHQTVAFRNLLLCNYVMAMSS